MRKLAVLTALLGVALVPSMAGAALLATFEGNDCAGVFGKSFSECKIPVEFDDPGQSPIIAKWDDAEGWTFNTDLFPTIDGSEWVFDPANPGGSISGSWTYTPAPDDPGINFWTVKAGPAFNLYSAEGLTDSWDTEIGLEGKGVSHISFYDTGGSADGGGADGGGAPEPGLLMLLGAGLVAVAARVRRSF